MVQIQRFSGFESLEGARSDADDMLKPQKLERAKISHFRKNTMGYNYYMAMVFCQKQAQNRLLISIHTLKDSL